MSLDAGDRKYIKLTALFFGLLALVGLGAALYRPLRLRYAMYRVERDYPLVLNPDVPVGTRFPLQCNEWLWLCVQAAERGNPRAMELVCERSGVPVDMPIPGLVLGESSHWAIGRSVAFHAARAQPQLFLSFLDKKDDWGALGILAEVSAPDPRLRNSGARLMLCDAGTLRDEFGEMSLSLDPAEAGLGAAVSDYLRHRFPDELAEPGKKNPE